MLRHANYLVELENEVTIIGVSNVDEYENGVFFKGCATKSDVQEYLKLKFDQFDIIFINIKEDLNILKFYMPHSRIIEVCQNGPHFNNDKFIDIYAFVGYGQFAFYSVKYKRYRNKFMMLPNVSVLDHYGDEINGIEETEQIIWVGGLNKQGLRRWGNAMSKILEIYPDLIWKLCIPSYDLPKNKELPIIFSGLNLPQDRLIIQNLNSQELAKEIKKSKILLTSLGGEDGPSAYLDGHALGIPVLSADDIIGKFSNPEGTGIRCTSKKDCYNAINYLLQNKDVRIQLGKNGKKWYENNYPINLQNHLLEQIIQYLSINSDENFPRKTIIQSDRKFSIRFYLERMEIKLIGLKFFK